MATRKKKTVKRVAPQQERSLQTRERLLDVAGTLLAEIGIERISTNLICARAGMTPPALYRYFKDKYAVLEALGSRLMERQNQVLLAWADKYAPLGAEALSENMEEMVRGTAKVTATEPGSLWTLRALRAVPQLAHVRTESHRAVTDYLAKLYAPLAPQLPRKDLWRRIRLSVEIGYALDEMLAEETQLSRKELIRDAARILRNSLRGE